MQLLTFNSVRLKKLIMNSNGYKCLVLLCKFLDDDKKAILKNSILTVIQKYEELSSNKCDELFNILSE